MSKVLVVFFKDCCLHSLCGLVLFCLSLKRITLAYLFQIAPDIVWLLRQILLTRNQVDGDKFSHLTIPKIEIRIGDKLLICSCWFLYGKGVVARIRLCEGAFCTWTDAISTPELFSWMRERRALGNPETKCLLIGFRKEQSNASLIGVFMLARGVSRRRKVQVQFNLRRMFSYKEFSRALGQSEAQVTRV